MSLDVEQALEEGILHRNLKAEGPIKYGWNKKSAGCKVRTYDLKTYWLKVHSRDIDKVEDKLWRGELDAPKDEKIKKPELINTFEWISHNSICRGDLFTYVSYRTCSDTPQIERDLQLGPRWLSDLKNSLKALRNAFTERVSVRQDLVNRRIKERFGPDISTSVNQWVTVHGDLHWANLTSPQCWILDWEAWGRGPAGLDPAFLYCFSLASPSLASKIYNYFWEELESPDGILSQAFAVAELLRMIELYGDHPILKEPLELHAEKIRLRLPREQ